MTLGMLQLLAIRFPGNQFRGEIIPELDAIREQGLARIIDLVFVYKDENGAATTVQFNDLTDEEKARFGITTGPLLDSGAGAEEGSVLEEGFGVTDEDIEEIAEEVPANNSILIVLFEHLWSLPFKQAVANANGRLLGNWIIQPELLVESDASLETERAGQPA